MDGEQDMAGFMVMAHLFIAYVRTGSTWLRFNGARPKGTARKDNSNKTDIRIKTICAI